METDNIMSKWAMKNHNERNRCTTSSSFTVPYSLQPQHMRYRTGTGLFYELADAPTPHSLKLLLPSLLPLSVWGATPLSIAIVATFLQPYSHVPDASIWMVACGVGSPSAILRKLILFQLVTNVCHQYKSERKS